MGNQSTRNTLKSELNPDQESLATFENKITRAASQGMQWIETSSEVMDIMFISKERGYPHGYAIYRGIKVCEYGKTGEIEQAMAISCDEKLGLYKPIQYIPT